MYNSIFLPDIFHSARMASWGLSEKNISDAQDRLNKLREGRPEFEESATEEEKREAMLAWHTEINKYSDAIVRQRVQAETYLSECIEKVSTQVIDNIDLIKFKNGKYNLRLELQIEDGKCKIVLLDVGRHFGRGQIYSPADIWGNE